MLSIFDLCQPRDEVLRGDLREDTFAAQLKDVMDRRADPVYGDARVFFENTYPTTGLKSLLSEALARLVGDAAGRNAIIRLETAFGGGKTHNLIALYHAASGYAPADLLVPFLPPATPLPRPAQIRIAGLVGYDLDPASGCQHPESGVTTYTLWGELAYQLGQKAGYELARASDERRVAPGTGLLERLVGDQPTLIMVDEIARHLRVGKAVLSETKASNLADQTIAFLMSLLEFAASKERCVVALTLASESDAFRDETAWLHQRLNEARQISARQERVLTPTVENEIPAIVTHRLFKRINHSAAATVCAAYARYYDALFQKNADLPQRATRAEYHQEMASAYPFHPELLNTLNHKTATIPNFNQTRGALRLLAWTVRALWERRPADTWLIHLHHIDLDHPQIAEDLTGHLDRPKFKQVIEADITSALKGSAAHAHDVDEPLRAAGRPPYARRLATAILIHSLTQGIASGVDPADLLLAVATPGDDGLNGDDPGVIQRALENLYKKAWFLEYDGHRYRFKTEPSLNKIIEDEMTLVARSRAVTELEGRIRQIWKRGFLQPAFFAAEPADVDDDAALPKLALIHFDAATAGPADAPPPDLVRRIYEYSGIAESFRRYQNHIFFLVADADQVENMTTVARRYLAIGRIVGDAARMVSFHQEQRDELKKMREAAELEVRIAITRAYRYLYYPTPDAPKTHSYLRRETLPPQEQGDVDKDQANVLVRHLRSLKAALTADDEPLAALFVKAKAWELNQASISTDDLLKAFARKIGLPTLFDVGQLRKTIQNGVKTGVWLYYDAAEGLAYDADSPPTAWRIADDAFLYLPEEAARLGLRIKGKWQPPVHEGGGGGGITVKEERCPVCGRPVAECICGAETGGIPARLSASGPVNQAFQRLQDQCQEYQVARLAELTIAISGVNKQAAADLRSLGVAIPQLGAGDYRIALSLVAALGPADSGETLKLDFAGAWERYRKLKPAADALAQEASELNLGFSVRIAYPNGLELASDAFASLRDILVTLGVSKVSLDAAPQEGA